MSSVVEIMMLVFGIMALFATLGALYFHEQYFQALSKSRNADELVQNLAVGVYRSSLSGKQLSANRALVELNGYDTEEELLDAVEDIGREWYVDPNRREEFSRVLENEGEVKDFVSEIYRHKTRERIWISETARLVRHRRTGKPLYYEGTVRDITDQIEKQTSDKLLKNLTEKLPHGLFRLVRHPDRTFSSPFASRRFYEMLGLDQSESFDAAAFDANVHPEDREHYHATLKHSRKKMVPWVCEFRFFRADGSTDWCKLNATPENGKDGEIIWHGYLSIITSRKETEEKIYRLAYFDPLTGLSNRTCFMQEASTAIEKANDTKCLAALGFIDLDNFKILNDTHGHAFGDKLLVAVAGRLKKALPKTHLLGRFGGDEFVVMLPSLGKDPQKAQKKAERISQNLLKEVQRGFAIDGIDCPMTLSLGLSMYDPAAKPPLGDLLKSADIAMYEAKKSGRNNIVMHTVKMLEKVTERFKLQREIQIAIRDEQFEIELQPQVSKSGDITFAETLIRWNHPEFGRIMPADFIGAAEQTGQIGKLNEWVLRRTVELLSSWKDDHALSKNRLSVNISPRQMIDPAFVDRIVTLLDEFNVPGSSLVLELTEHAMARNPQAVKSHMKKLQKHGIRFSLDDFGTGYSSISQLRQFPFNELKIDGSFVSDIATEHEARNIVRAIINMAKALGLETVAEHVTDYSQFETLSELGCDLFQGYLFSRPLSIQDFEYLILARNASTPKRIPSKRASKSVKA